MNGTITEGQLLIGTFTEISEELSTFFSLKAQKYFIYLFIAIFLDNYVRGKRRKEFYGTHVKPQPYQARPQSPGESPTLFEE